MCVSSTFTSVQEGGNCMPNWTKLYTRKPQIVGLWPGDSLEFHAAKVGTLLMLPMRAVKQAAELATAR